MIVISSSNLPCLNGERIETTGGAYENPCSRAGFDSSLSSYGKTALNGKMPPLPPLP